MAAALNAIWIASLFMFLTYSGPLANAQASVFFWFFAGLGVHWRAVLAARQELPGFTQQARINSGVPRGLSPALAH